MATLSSVLENVPAGVHSQGRARLAMVLYLWHLTSLDAPTVAVVWTLAFARTAHVSLPLWLPAVLALSAWSVYIGDRLMDVYGAHRRGATLLSGATALRPRHHFHWRHRRILLPIAFVAAGVAAGLVLHSMPVAARERNSLLAAAALAYFGGVHSPWRPAMVKMRLPIRLPKELLVGILFTLACAVPGWTRMEGERLTLIPAVVAFILLAWLNCYAIEAWEAGGLREGGRVGHLGFVLAGVALAAAFVFSAMRAPQPTPLLVCAAAAAILTALLDRIKHRMDATTLRAAADMVLLTPLALVLWR